MTTQLVSTFLRTKVPTSLQMSEMRDVISQINSSYDLMNLISKDTDVPHLNMLIDMNLNVSTFTRFLLKSNRDDLFDYMINNREFLAALSQNLTHCSPYAFDMSLAIGIAPHVRDIYYAGKDGNTDKVNKLILYGGDVKGSPEGMDVFGCALEGPVLAGHDELAFHLLSLGANVTPKCLYHAMTTKNYTLFVALIDSSIALNDRVIGRIRQLLIRTSPEINEEIKKRNLLG